MYMYAYILLTSNGLLHSERFNHRLNMELDLQSLFGLHCMSRDAHSCTHWLRPRTPLPAFGLVYEGAIGQPR
jgi:hypothetical protein